MAGKFDLNAYIEVQDRINRFWSENPVGSINTEIAAPTEFDQIVIRALVYKHRDHARPDATGIAAEEKGKGGMANTTSWHENCETSAIGRALANMGYATSNKDRPSKEEMQKVERMQAQAKEPEPIQPVDLDDTSFTNLANTAGTDPAKWKRLIGAAGTEPDRWQLLFEKAPNDAIKKRLDELQPTHNPLAS